MKRRFMDMKFYETYYYANIISNVLADPYDYLSAIHAWHENRSETMFSQAFPKRSLLHDFVEHVISSVVSEDVSDSTVDAIVNRPASELWVDMALRHHGTKVQGFRIWLQETGIGLDELSEDHIAEYHQFLYDGGELEALIEQITNEVFFVVFGNRMLLARFNDYVARIHADTHYDPEGIGAPVRFQPLARAHIPSWARNAVFFRDRGLCTSCRMNISGLFTTQPERHLDHIVPLAVGGVNDVTNLQLLCEACNLAKGPNQTAPSEKYEAWY